MKMKVYADSMDIGRGLRVSDLQNEGEKITKRNPVREHPSKDGKNCESIIYFYSVADGRAREVWHYSSEWRGVVGVAPWSFIAVKEKKN